MDYTDNDYLRVAFISIMFGATLLFLINLFIFIQLMLDIG